MFDDDIRLGFRSLALFLEGIDLDCRFGLSLVLRADNVWFESLGSQSLLRCWLGLFVSAIDEQPNAQPQECDQGNYCYGHEWSLHR
jgi:hypothetical protein